MERGASEEICAFAKKSEIARKSCGESAQRFTFLMKFRFKSLFSLWQWYFQWRWWQIIIITVAGHRHIIVDSACNALYVFPDKTLRTQSENQSPRWCYQTKEKGIFSRPILNKSLKKGDIRCIWSLLASRLWHCDINPDTAAPPLSWLSGISGNTKTASDRVLRICKTFHTVGTQGHFLPFISMALFQ